MDRAGPEQIVAGIVAEGVAPNAAAGAARRTPRGWIQEVGGEADTLFDLASLTKPMTAVAIARAGLNPATPLVAVVPEARNTPSAEVPLELLLAHRAGFVAHLPLWRAPGEERAAVLEPAFADDALVAHMASARRPEVDGAIPPHGFPPLYRDVGYLLAGVALARHTGARDAGEAIEQLVVRPLGLERELGTVRGLVAQGIDVVARAAPTEHVLYPDGRRAALRGVVHDENARALTRDGGSGHAGMFGTARAVLTFGAAFLDALEGRPSPLAGAPLDWLVRERGDRATPGGTLRAGFDGKSPTGSSTGERCGPNTFGHLGFTGTSLWIDPDAKAVITLLTNRVNPTRANLAIREARPRAHDALFDRALALDGGG